MFDQRNHVRNLHYHQMVFLSFCCFRLFYISSHQILIYVMLQPVRPLSVLQASIIHDMDEDIASEGLRGPLNLRNALLKDRQARITYKQAQWWLATQIRSILWPIIWGNPYHLAGLKGRQQHPTLTETLISLHWRHNGRDCFSSHQPQDCLLKRLFRRRSKETSKLRVTGLCAGNSPGPVNSPHKWPVTRKMFPFDDVIMCTRMCPVIKPLHNELFTYFLIFATVNWCW